MGDSVFWSEKENGYEGILTSEGFHCFEAGNQEYGSKRIRLSPEFNQQEGEPDSSSGESNPLGLTLKKTPSFLSLLQRTLSKGKDTDFITSHENDNKRPRTKTDDSEKLKASNFPAVFINIGAWQRTTRNEGDLTAKLYYAKRKLVWEVLDGALKSKIEIQWSDIIGIRAILPDNEHGTLEIELNNPPLYYREINPQPRKHTLWQQSSDFTGGQAPIWRRHHVKFPPGILDKHYEKLLQCDERLFGLSQKPFPTHESAYFDPTMFEISEMYLSFNSRSSYLSRMQFPYHSYPPRVSPLLPPMPNPTTPAMNLAHGNEGGSINPFVNNYQGGSQVYEYPQSYYHHNQESNVGLLSDIENHLLGESQVLYSDEGTLGENMESMCSLLEPTAVMNYAHDQNHSSRTYQGDHRAMMNSIGYPICSDGFYTEGVNNWLPPLEDQCYNEAVVMEDETSAVNNNSVPPFMFPFPGNNNPTSRDFFF